MTDFNISEPSYNHKLTQPEFSKTTEKWPMCQFCQIIDIKFYKESVTHNI